MTCCRVALSPCHPSRLLPLLLLLLLLLEEVEEVEEVVVADPTSQTAPTVRPEAACMGKRTRQVGEER